ncbi:hypothetical protein I4U23_021986 [Adineta vaga]|nr:hypothetical protein I4U23_021986 [Adineta vaga]
MSQTKFEILPNEILLQCFHYLNIIDIFHSFDQLNQRFNSLIRNIPFCLTFENIQNKFQCKEFCQKLSTDETVRNQVYSIHLSNKETCYPVHLFLSKFSLLQFPRLRSLTLHEITTNNWKNIRPTLSSISELSSFHMMNCDKFFDNPISQLPMSQLQTLIIPQQLFPRSISYIEFSSIIDLSISLYYFNDICIIFNDVIKLKYLKINRVVHKTINETENNVKFLNSSSNTLITFHTNSFDNDVSYLFMLLKGTPNLENLIISSNNNSSMINASEWKHFIISSLTHLKNFKFHFSIDTFSQNNINEQSLKEFQNDFWYNEHHWYTEYIISTCSTLLYTIPYSYVTFTILPNSHRYYNESINHQKTFDNVKYLRLEFQVLTNRVQYYFPNVDSLSIVTHASSLSGDIEMNYSHLKSLKTIVNLSNIKCLIVNDDVRCEAKYAIKELFKSATQLTTLNTNLSNIISWFDDDELCKYLKKTIKKLDIGVDLLQNSDDLERFCEIFSNLEQLECSSNELNTLFLIEHLPNLIYMKIYPHTSYKGLFLFKEEVKKVNLDMILDFGNDDYPFILFIWIN